MPVFRHIASLLFASAVFCSAAAAQSVSGDLNAVLRQMDAASARFKSAEASFRFDNYERVVRETTTQSGTIYFRKSAEGLEMGLRITSPELKLIDFRKGVLRLFDPRPDQLTIIDAGKNRSMLESFLTLGFGGSGSDLAKTWTITDQGTESVSDGQRQTMTRKLELVPKDPGARGSVARVILWVDASRGVSLKQQIFTPSGDSRTAFYSNIRINQPINTRPYAITPNRRTSVVNR